MHCEIDVIHTLNCCEYKWDDHHDAISTTVIISCPIVTNNV